MQVDTRQILSRGAFSCVGVHMEIIASFQSELAPFSLENLFPFELEVPMFPQMESDLVMFHQWKHCSMLLRALMMCWKLLWIRSYQQQLEGGQHTASSDPGAGAHDT